MIKRREFITLLGAAAAAWPLAARGQRSERVRQIGVLMGTSESDPDQKGMVSTFTRALTDLGWTEGTNIRIERRWAEGDFARLRTHALDLARLAPDAIFAQGTPATTALRQAAPATPLVFVMITDPISSGLVSSFAHPGGNITGFTNYEFSMGGKWLEILKEMTASVDHVAVVFNPDNLALHGQLRSIEVAGPTFRIQVNAKPARNAETIERIIRAFATEPNGRRREFITLLGGAAATWPLAAGAQQTAMPVIGCLSPASPESYASRACNLSDRGCRRLATSKGRTSRSSIAGQMINSSGCRNWRPNWCGAKRAVIISAGSTSGALAAHLHRDWTEYIPRPVADKHLRASLMT